jgi:hypothetical protein
VNKRANYSPVPNEKGRIAKTMPYALHISNPPGSKLIRKFYRNRNEVKRGFLPSLEWYRKYDPAEEKKRSEGRKKDVEKAQEN